MSLDKLGKVEYQKRLAKVFEQYRFDGQVWIVDGCPELPQAFSFADLIRGNYDEYPRFGTAGDLRGA